MTEIHALIETLGVDDPDKRAKMVRLIRKMDAKEMAHLHKTLERSRNSK